MKTVTVASRREMMATLEAHGQTPTPIPTGDWVEVDDLRIERAMRETSFYGCNHSVSTTRFSKERDWCEACQTWRTVR